MEITVHWKMLVDKCSQILQIEHFNLNNMYGIVLCLCVGGAYFDTVSYFQY